MMAGRAILRVMHRRAVVLLLAAVWLAGGCASGDDTGAGKQANTGSSPGGSSAKVVEVTVAVRDGTVKPAPHRVDVPLGSQIRLQVTSDVDDEVHVHGLDVEEPLDAGRTTTIELTADQPGLYEVETHESDLQLLQLEVR
jgi:hypothetical protein